jgi:hypothetical protein
MFKNVLQGCDLMLLFKIRARGCGLRLKSKDKL